MAAREPSFALSEMRSSRDRGPRAGSIALWVGILGLIGAGLFLHGRLARCPLWTVRSVEVEGNRSLATGDLLDQLRLHPGMPWWRFTLRPAHRLLAREPRIAQLSVHWRWPRDLVVRVRERESFLRVLADPPLEVATDGMLIETREELDPADLPLLTGALPPGLAPCHTLELAEAGAAWREFVQIAQTTPELWKNVSQIQYSGGRDFQLFLRGGRRVILWETGINTALKSSLPEILADLEKRGEEDVVVDLRFRDQVVLRLPGGAAEDSASAPPAGRAPQKAAGGGRHRA